MQHIRLFQLFLLGCIAFPFCSYGWQYLDRSIDITCVQDTDTVDCRYRLLNGETVSQLQAFAGNQALRLDQIETSDKQDSVILFMVDTSDPGRQNVVEKNKAHIARLLNATPENMETGLGSFDRTFRIEAAPGESRFLLNKRLQSLQARGKTTELYHSLLEAINYLGQFQAQQKLIVLLSDGQAEDKAYFHSDVVNAARKNHIAINAIGYPRTVALSVALQTIRRLSEETGGHYIEANNRFELPESYFRNPYKNITRAGRFEIALKETVAGTTAVQLKLTIVNNSPLTLRIPVLTKPTIRPVAAASPRPAAAAIAPGQTTSPVVQVITRESKNEPVNLWSWYGIPAAFIIIIVLILITLLLLWYRTPVDGKRNREEEYKPYAYLVSREDTTKRYPITRTIWRIGRGKDNELSINDNSISRKHAEIHRNADGSFDIRYMNSMNGLYINSEKIGKAVLQEGDILEIGDVFLIFTRYASDYADEQSTVMQKTKTPISSWPTSS